MIPLFEQYPSLSDKLPYVHLGEFPTPIQKLDKLGRQIGLDNLYIKRDDLSGKLYGGNKVRKLEFLLGKACSAKVKEVLTFGSAGSNHALATAIYARQLGLKSISMLIPQPNARYVRRNLLMSHYCGVELHLVPSDRPSLASAVNEQLLRHRYTCGQFPQVIPMGGSSPVGMIGFVNAAFEISRQIMNGEMPEPDYLYVASGSMGTAAGLTLGLKAIKSKTQVVPVSVTSEKFVNVKGMLKLINKTNHLLYSMAPTFPDIDISGQDINLRHDFFGEQYALFTEEGMEAVHLIDKTEGIKLEGTYTGKALAALINDAQKQRISGKVVLFWNTYNSRDFSDLIAGIDYHNLPPDFHQYFEQDVQPLDKD